MFLGTFMFDDKLIISFIKGYNANLELLNTNLIGTHVLHF